MACVLACSGAPAASFSGSGGRPEAREGDRSCQRGQGLRGPAPALTQASGAPLVPSSLGGLGDGHPAPLVSSSLGLPISGAGLWAVSNHVMRGLFKASAPAGSRGSRSPCKVPSRSFFPSPVQPHHGGRLRGHLEANRQQEF